jgi:hypothetical protein
MPQDVDDKAGQKYGTFQRKKNNQSSEQQPHLYHLQVVQEDVIQEHKESFPWRQSQ